MERQPIPLDQLKLNPFTALGGLGALLVCGTGVDDANVMTIGWGFFGLIWGRPAVQVLVRPTRHPWSFIERLPDFTVNWLPGDRKAALGLCGSKSGRDLDKFIAAGLTPLPGTTVASPLLAESALALECRILYRDQLDPAKFQAEAIHAAYPLHDYHGLFTGEVLAAFGTTDFLSGD
jgi:flavin reductase (DIM6/NTAB) family NADH-FMN oxidoreductase RutF